MDWQAMLEQFASQLDQTNDINQILALSSKIDECSRNADHQLQQLQHQKNKLLLQECDIDKDLVNKQKQLKLAQEQNQMKIEQQANEEQISELQERLEQILKFGNATIKPIQLKLLCFNQKEMLIEVTKVMNYSGNTLLEVGQENKVQIFEILYDLEKMNIRSIKDKKQTGFYDMQQENISPEVRQLWQNDFESLLTINLNQLYEKD